MVEVDDSQSVKELEDGEQIKPPALWYRPPHIIPNYGAKNKRNNVIPKSKVQHVLLHDNKNQKNILDSKVKYISNDYKRFSRLSELHKRSFLVRQSMKQVGLWQKGIDHVELLPEVVVQMHCPGNSKEHAKQTAQGRRNSITKAERQAMYAEDEDFLRQQEEYQNYQQMISRKRRLSRQVSIMSMTDINRYRVQSEAGEIPSHGGQPREKTNITTTGRLQRPANQTLSRQQSFIYNRSKTAMPNMEAGMTRKFSTYNLMPRRDLITAGHKSFINRRAAEDPRFKGLRNQLIAPEKPIDGFMQLSPCGPKVMQKYGSAPYDEGELANILNKLNDVSYMSTRKIRSAKRKEEEKQRNLLPVRQAFVQDEDDKQSLYSSSDSFLIELH